MAPIGTVDERFQSYDIEMIEVTGGRFWKPYRDIDAMGEAASSADMDAVLYQYRPPIDLANPRLRALAAALGPAYLRVSGTWANATYFRDADGLPPATPPAGFTGVLTRRQWRGVVDFARVVDAKIVTSFAVSPGARDARGLWTRTGASKLVAYTRSIGGSIAAAEFMNEPTDAEMAGAPKEYDAAAYGRDIAVFRSFLKRVAPGIVFLGPGSVGEGLSDGLAGGRLKSEDLLAAAGPVFDAFSYHFYGAASERCAKVMPGMAASAEAALSEEWLSRTDSALAFYARLRDRFAPEKPIWITETADAACGGNRWGSTFLDSFRYLDQLGRLAERGVQVIIHNTLASSDYGLLDERTFAPRPNYWAALLWRKLMGTTVLDPGPSPAASLHLYAHCLRGEQGGVALLAINLDRVGSQSLDLPTGAERYSVSAQSLTGKLVRLNGSELRLGPHDELPPLEGRLAKSGRVTFAPVSITFLAIPNAHNAACR